MNRRKGVSGLLAALLLLSSCTVRKTESPSASLTFLALDTVNALTVRGEKGEEALSRIKEGILSMEEELSRTRAGSKVYEINHGEGLPAAADEEILHLLEYSEELSGQTNGIFDITIAPAADLWGFTKEEFRVPSDEEIAQVRPRVGMEHLHRDGGSVQLDAGSEIDFGGIAKGYALERSLEVFRELEPEGGSVNLGGDILVYGEGPRGPLWHVGIRDPHYRDGGNTMIGIFTVSDRYIVTSGGYERYFEADGKRYQHIIDPRTCCPAESTLESVTVVTTLREGYGIAADALATALYVMGPEDAAAFWREQGRWFDMILIDSSDTVYLTEGAADCFSLSEPDRYRCILLS